MSNFGNRPAPRGSEHPTGAGKRVSGRMVAEVGYLSQAEHVFEMDPFETKRITEGIKRLSDDDRAFILNWLLLYFEDDGRMRSPRAHRRTITLDQVPYQLVRIVRKRPVH